MEFTELVLAGTISEVPDSSTDLSGADALGYKVHDEADIDYLKEYDRELPIIVMSPVTDIQESDQEEAFDVIKQCAELDAVEAIEINYTTLLQTDVDIESLHDLGVSVIIAYRNSIETPEKEELFTIVEKASEYGDLVYIETFASSLTDALDLLNVIYETSEQQIAIGGTCNGELGSHTKIAAPVYGSKLVYAPINVGEDVESMNEKSINELAELIHEFQDPSTETSLSDAITNPMIRDIQ